MISFRDTLLLSSTISNSHENERETQTSNDLMEKSLQTDISNEYLASFGESYTEINHSLYTLQTENEMLKVDTKKWFNKNDEKVLFYTGLANFKVLQTVFDFLFSLDFLLIFGSKQQSCVKSFSRNGFNTNAFEVKFDNK